MEGVACPWICVCVCVFQTDAVFEPHRFFGLFLDGLEFVPGVYILGLVLRSAAGERAGNVVWRDVKALPKSPSGSPSSFLS